MSAEAELRASPVFDLPVILAVLCHILTGTLLHEAVGRQGAGRGSLQVNPLILSEQQQIPSRGGSFSEGLSNWCIRRSAALWYIKYLF